MIGGKHDKGAAGKQAASMVSIDNALSNLKSMEVDFNEAEERDLIGALQGQRVREIGRFQVYTSYSENETVVFVHDPTGTDKHRYVIVEDQITSHRYVVAAPTYWTPGHYDIVARITASMTNQIICEGGGYVDLLNNGALTVRGESFDYGPGNHEYAQEKLRKAVIDAGSSKDAK